MADLITPVICNWHFPPKCHIHMPIKATRRLPQWTIEQECYHHVFTCLQRKLSKEKSSNWRSAQGTNRKSENNWDNCHKLHMLNDLSNQKQLQSSSERVNTSSTTKDSKEGSWIKYSLNNLNITENKIVS